MFTALRVRNFKSLADFNIKLESFNCLIGMNGAGKSTVLQAIDFVSRLMLGRLDEWFTARQWDAQDIYSKFDPEKPVEVSIGFTTRAGAKISWEATFRGGSLLCEREWLSVDRDHGIAALRVVGGQVARYRAPLEDIAFDYQGSILSQLKDSTLDAELIEFRNAVRGIRSLELMAPNLIRQRGRSSDEEIGIGGEMLSAFLHGSEPSAKARLLDLLKGFYPSLVDFTTIAQSDGSTKLAVIEQFGDRRIETDARHLNDGLLRVLAMLAQIGSDRPLVLFDEVENGINPEVVERLVDALVSSQRQMLVTTHSPMILNYLDDDVARDAVQFVYKNALGETRARPFFSIGRIGDKLNLMGPGEAFVDTDLLALTAECVELDKRDADASATGNVAPAA